MGGHLGWVVSGSSSTGLSWTHSNICCLLAIDGFTQMSGSWLAIIWGWLFCGDLALNNWHNWGLLFFQVYLLNWCTFKNKVRFCFFNKAFLTLHNSHSHQPSRLPQSFTHTSDSNYLNILQLLLQCNCPHQHAEGTALPGIVLIHMVDTLKKCPE